MSRADPSSAWISRSAGPLAVRAARIGSVQAVAALHRRDFAAHRLAVSDLSLGPWRSQQAARELFAQFGAPLPREEGFPRYAERSAAAPAYGELIGYGIDAEARGDGVVLRALALASQLTRQLETDSRPCAVFVLAPRFGLAWGRENLWFTRFLVQGLQGTAHRLVILCPPGEGGGIPEDWEPSWIEDCDVAASADPPSPFALVPGVVDPEVRAALGGGERVDLGLTLGGGSHLVPPEARRAPSESSPFDYDALAASAGAVHWLRAYAQFRGNNYFVDVDLLRDYALRCYAEGGHDIALAVMERAHSCARGTAQRSRLEAQLQGMRLALHRFHAAATAADPSPSFSADCRRFLLEAKGWAFVMTSREAEGRDYIVRAQAVPSSGVESSVDGLYLRNILGLALAGTGDLDGAMAQERCIDELNARGGVRDWRLHYVNSINTARLHRKAGRLDEAERFYRRAFSTSCGGRSEGDLIYDNACLARLASEAGRHAEAMRGWFRAALHFAACLVPEAVSRRYAAMIVGRGGAPEGDMPEAIAAALSLHLLAAGRLQPEDSPWRLAATAAPVGSDAPVFLSTDAFAVDEVSRRVFTALGAPGWSVLASSERPPAPYEGSSHRALRGLLAHLIRRAYPASPLERAGSYLVDSRSGRDVAMDEREQIEACVRLGVADSLHGSVATSLTETARAALRLSCRVGLGDLVAGVVFEGQAARVRFKRYSPERVESDAHGLIALAAAGSRTLGSALAALGPDVVAPALTQALALERARVIHLDLPEDWRSVLENGVDDGSLGMVSGRVFL